jgi:hypothetical protein
MGLDMYLYRREYVGGWEWKDRSAENDLYDAILAHTGLPRCEGSPHAMVDIVVAYWRKANQVHKWFCDLDGGRDECQRIYVTKQNLIDLRDKCAAILLEPANAPALLPTQAGFFFGSYEYDEWYMEDMRNTVEQIDTVLAACPDEWADFYYQASW